MTRKGFEAIARALVERGVEIVFGLMGDANLELIVHLVEQHGVRYIGTRHASTAVTMADGYARVTGRLGICTVTRGPGLTNALTALTSVARAETPVVLLAGDSPSQPGEARGLAHLQSLDERAVGDALGVRIVGLQRGRVYETLMDTLVAARERFEPSLVLMPTDVQGGDEPVTPLYYGEPREGNVRVPADSMIEEVARLLYEAFRPVVLAGRGAVRSGARDVLSAIAERTGALLTTSLMAKGLFRGDPYYVGTCGGFASPVAAALLREADVVLAVGASLNDYTTMRTSIFGEAQVVHVDQRAASIGRFMPVHTGVVGDAAATCEAILSRLPPDPARRGYRSERVARTVAEEDRWSEIQQRQGSPIDPRALALRLNELLPEDRTLVIDSGHHCGFSGSYIDVVSPERLMFTLDFAAVGMGLGTALGASIANPDGLTVLAIGDGGLMMNLGDLSTIGHLRLPVLVVVWNDEAFGAEVHTLRSKNLPDDLAIFDSPDLAEVAGSLGVGGYRIETLEELEHVVASLNLLSGPTLLDCRVDRNVIAPFLHKEHVLAKTVAPE